MSLALPRSRMLSDALPLPPLAASRRWLPLLAVGGAALVLGAASAAPVLCPGNSPGTSETQTTQFSLIPPPGVTLAVSVNQIVPAVSPDGRQVVFIGSRQGEPSRLWIRPLDSLNARPLTGTDDARSPFWSPDSRKLAFFAEDKLKIIDIAGGAASLSATCPMARAIPARPGAAQENHCFPGAAADS